MKIYDGNIVKSNYQKINDTVQKPVDFQDNPILEMGSDGKPVRYDKLDIVSKSSAENTEANNNDAKQQNYLQTKSQVDLESMRANLQASQEEIDAAEEAFNNMIKCLQISGNIIRGENVPATDHKFLQDNDPELYMLSISSKMPNDNPKDMEKVAKDSESEGDSEMSAGEVESSATSSEFVATESEQPQTETKE